MEKTRRILILGSNGRLGAALMRRYSHDHEVIGLGHADLDLLRLDEIAARLGRHEFDAVINAAGITSVDHCETHPADARAANALGPEIVARVCRERGARFINISSDYVFPGTGRELLRESDPTGATNVYGATKLEGEQLVLAAQPDALVVRVSWLFGLDKDSFPDRIIKTALASDHVDAVADKWSAPTYAEDLAGWLLPFLHEHHAVSGVLHLCNAGAASWQEYGQYALDLAVSLGLPVRTREVKPFSMIGFPEFKADRPPFTAMSTATFERFTGKSTRAWQPALEEYLRARYKA